MNVSAVNDVDVISAAGGIAGAIVGRALYEGTLELGSAQRVADGMDC